MTENSHKSKHDYDREYMIGAHWEKNDKPSSNMPRLIKYLEGGETILDVGCGSGRDPVYLADRGYNVTGIDQSWVAIEKAVKKTVGKPNIHFEVGLIENLPYKDSSFDAAYSGYTLGGLTFPQQVSEVARVLKPGGIFYLVIFTHTKYDNPCERDEENPRKWVMENVKSSFKVLGKEEDSYQEPDDLGMHTHHRLRLALRKTV